MLELGDTVSLCQDSELCHGDCLTPIYLFVSGKCLLRNAEQEMNADTRLMWSEMLSTLGATVSLCG